MSNVKELNINSTTYDIIGKGVVDQNNTSNAIKTWSGTRAQYNAIATKDSNTLYNITDDTTLLLSVPNLFDFKWADHELNSQCWLRADTYSWQDGTVYSDAYNHLVDDINGKTASTETINGTTVTYYLADDGHKIVKVAKVSAVETVYNSTGVAWYYILDTTNHRFKLPRTQYGFTGLRDTVGKYVPESLPNITGTFGNTTRFSAADMASKTSGAFSFTNQGKPAQYSTGGDVGGYVSFNASDSSSIYQDNAPVQQRATQMYLYFYVGQFSQTATEQTAGLNTELFNGKADIDLSNAAQNASTSAKETVVGWGMPDYTAGVSKSHNTQYTADKNGFLYASVTMNNSFSDPYVTISGTSLQIGTNTAGTTVRCQGYFFIRKGSTYKVTGGSTNGIKIYFYPCLGG